jgi:type IV pilus assembly protein PilC
MTLLQRTREKIPGNQKKDKAKEKLALTRYRYEAIDDSGNQIKGFEMSESAGRAHLALLERGLSPTLIEEKRTLLQFEITKKRVPKKEVMNFTRQLAVFIRSGIPIMDALEVIVEEAQNKLMRQILLQMIEDLRAGDTFSVACSSHPEAFPNFYVGILESAELTGNLDDVLEQLAEYMDRDLKARAKISSALTYPAVVSVLAVVVIFILGIFVLPRFVVFFSQLHAKLPAPTRALMAFSGFMASYWPFLLAFIVIVVGGFMVMKRSEKGQDQIDRVMLKLPILGDLTQTAVLERTCRILASMLRAGVDLPRSMIITADSANNAVYRKGLMAVREEVMEGQGLAAPIARSGLYPGAARQMFRVGEETGSLDQQLEVAASYYNRELERKLDRVTSLFEPMVIIFMGLIVGFVAVALISAMYGIYNQVH